jgi:hypothetical protein
MGKNSDLTGKNKGLLFIITLALALIFFALSLKAGYAADDSAIPLTEQTQDTSASVQQPSDSLDNAEVYINIDNISQTSESSELNQSDVEIILNSPSNETSDLNNNESTNLDEAESSFSGGDSNYNYIDLKLIENQAEQTEQSKQENQAQIDYVLYKGNAKVLETTALESEDLVINTAETVINEGDWKKEVKVYSAVHHDNPITIYSDIPEDESGRIKLFWREEDRFLTYDSSDTNRNGIVDRISWIIPHLSEQNFEISIIPELSIASDNSSGSDNSTTNATQTQILITQPTFTSNVTSPSVLLAFSVNETNGNIPLCNFSFFKAGIIQSSAIFSSSTATYNLSVDNGFYSWNVACVDEVSNVSNSSTGNFAVSLISVPQISFTSSASSASRGTALTFFVYIAASITPIQYALDWGDGSTLVNPGAMNVLFFNSSINHTYQTTGTFNAMLTVFVAGISYQKNLAITVTNNADKTDPAVTLISPSNNEEIESSSANFSYKASDNVYVSNCTLSIYFYNNSLLGTLVYSTTSTSVNGQTINVSLVDFDYGDYSWDVSCYDNSSNYADESRDFSMVSVANLASTQSAAEELNLSEEDRKTVTLIDYLLSKINNFTSKENSYDIKAKEAISDLKIDDKMTNYKKLLLQMKQDISYNLGYMHDDSLRQARKKQILDQIDEIQSNIPNDLSVVNSYDYYKTESRPDIQSILQNYAKSQGISVSDASLQAMTDYIANLQESAIISNNVKAVEIDYVDRSEEITLISKSVDIKNNSFDSVIESVPAKLSTAEIVFVTKNKALGNQYFQIQPGDLTNGAIIYYIKEQIDLKKIEGTSEILFADDAMTLKIGGISGFVTSLGSQGIGRFGFYIACFVFVSLAIFLGGTYFVRQVTISRLSDSSPEFREILSKIKNASISVKNKEFDLAKSDYRAIRENYLKLPEKARQLTYKKIERLQIELDRKEAISLAKEFLNTIKQGRKEEARLIYKKIKLIYSRLLEKDREKIFSRITPYISSLNS